MTTTPRRVIRFGVLPPTVAIAELDRIPSGETIALYGNVGMARHSRCMKENYSTLFGLRTKILQTTQKNTEDDNNNNNNNNRKITIASFSLENHCEEREEHSKWFHFCVEFLHTNPRTTTFEYNGGHQSSSITLGCANKFAASLHAMSRSPNIAFNLRTCVLRSSYTNVQAFQRVWDALLTTPMTIAVLKVSFHLHDTKDGNALEFSSLAHNTTLTQLEFSPEHRFGTNVLWDQFLAALHENTSLHTVHIFSLHVGPLLKKEISKQMKLNRIWNRYHTMKKNKKIGTSPSSTSSSAIITNVTPPSSSSSAVAVAASSKAEAEAAINYNASRVLETRLLLDTFITKPRCRETIIFTRLRESFDVFDNDTNKETNYLCRMLRTMNATSLDNNKDDDITGISNTDDPCDVSKDLKGNNNTTNTTTTDNNDKSFWLTISENPALKNCCVH